MKIIIRCHVFYTMQKVAHYDPCVTGGVQESKSISGPCFILLDALCAKYYIDVVNCLLDVLFKHQF